MAESVHVNFPSQVVSDLEKMSYDYGLKIARAIEQEWFNGTHSNKYYDAQSKFHKLRLYARGEQSIQKYKDELSINGDLSYLNLDWKPVPIIPKFVDIVVNGMSDRLFDIKAFSQDPSSVRDLSRNILLMIPPSLTFFIALYALLGWNASFIMSLFISIGLTAIVYWLYFYIFSALGKIRNRFISSRASKSNRRNEN